MTDGFIKKARILLIDDDEQLMRLLTIILQSEGHEIIKAHNGKKGVEAASTENPDIIVLDLSLPDIDGIDLISNIKEWSKVPVIVLSSQPTENDKIEALEHKADDYLVKPFMVTELVEKLNACLRSSSKDWEHENIIKAGKIKIDLTKSLVSVDGKPVVLNQKQYNLLKIFAANLGKVITNKQLMRAINGDTLQEEFHHLSFYIDELRKKIEPDPDNPSHIILEPKIGYRMIAA